MNSVIEELRPFSSLHITAPAEEKVPIIRCAEHLWYPMCYPLGLDYGPSIFLTLTHTSGLDIFSGALIAYLLFAVINRRPVVVEGGNVLNKCLNKYICYIKEEYMPEDESEQRAFCIKILERVVDRFAAEAFQSLDGSTVFSALLTCDEHEKLCGMDEVEVLVEEYMVDLD